MIKKSCKILCEIFFEDLQKYFHEHLCGLKCGKEGLWRAASLHRGTHIFLSFVFLNENDHGWVRWFLGTFIKSRNKYGIILRDNSKVQWALVDVLEQGREKSKKNSLRKTFFFKGEAGVLLEVRYLCNSDWAVFGWMIESLY